MNRFVNAPVLPNGRGRACCPVRGRTNRGA
jgi:hypothetical protein